MTANPRGKYPSGPSGKNTKPAVLVRATMEELALWTDAAASAAVTRNEWIVGVLNAAAQRLLKSGR